MTFHRNDTFCFLGNIKKKQYYQFVVCWINLESVRLTNIWPFFRENKFCSSLIFFFFLYIYIFYMCLAVVACLADDWHETFAYFRWKRKIKKKKRSSATILIRFDAYPHKNVNFSRARFLVPMCGPKWPAGWISAPASVVSCFFGFFFFVFFFFFFCGCFFFFTIIITRRGPWLANWIYFNISVYFILNILNYTWRAFGWV